MNLHFTIAKEDEEMFDYHVKKATEGKDYIYYIFLSKKKTDTVAADMSNNPFMLENGEVLYRPSGLESR